MKRNSTQTTVTEVVDIVSVDRDGLSRMERVVRELMNTQDAESITPPSLINVRPVAAARR